MPEGPAGSSFACRRGMRVAPASRGKQGRPCGIASAVGVLAAPRWRCRSLHAPRPHGGRAAVGGAAGRRRPPTAAARSGGLDASKTGAEPRPADRADGRGPARARYLSGDLDRRARRPGTASAEPTGPLRQRRRPGPHPAPAIIDYLGTRSGEVFTAEALARIESPDLRTDVRVAHPGSIRPGPDGSDHGDADRRWSVACCPTGMFGWGAVAIRAAFMQDIRVRIVSPSGNGEVWTPSYRWSTNRPRAMLRFDAPAPGRLPGMVSGLALAERQTYRARGSRRRVPREPLSRRRRAVRLGHQLAALGGRRGLRPIGPTSRLALEGSLNARAFGDRLALIASAGHWLGTGASGSFSTREFVATARSTRDRPTSRSCSPSSASPMSPKARRWRSGPRPAPAEGRGAFLRAHPLRSDSVISGEAFGRTLVFSIGGVPASVPDPVRHGGAGRIRRRRPRLAPARRTARRPFHVDIGTGMRLNAVPARCHPNRRRLRTSRQPRPASAGYVAPWGTR